MTEDTAKKFLQQRLEAATAALVRSRQRLEWHQKADAFCKQKFEEFQKSGEFGTKSALEMGRKARIEFEAIYGRRPATEYELYLKAKES